MRPSEEPSITYTHKGIIRVITDSLYTILIIPTFFLNFEIISKCKGLKTYLVANPDRAPKISMTTGTIFDFTAEAVTDC